MKDSIVIRPSKDLRNSYAQISDLAKDNTVAITVNGKEDLVVMSHDNYMEQCNYISRLEARITMYMHLAQAADDVKLGRVHDADEVLDEILSDLRNFEGNAYGVGYDDSISGSGVSETAEV